MSVPAYVTDEYVYYSNVLTPAAVLVTTPEKIVVPYNLLIDARSKADLDLLVQNNGGTLPLSDLSIAYETILPNGRSWFETYEASTVTVIPPLPTQGGGGGGGGSDYVLPAATSTTLGGVRVPLTSSISIDGSGNITYALPVATDDVLGGVRIPDDSAIDVDANGNLVVTELHGGSF